MPSQEVQIVVEDVVLITQNAPGTSWSHALVNLAAKVKQAKHQPLTWIAYRHQKSRGEDDVQLHVILVAKFKGGQVQWISLDEVVDSCWSGIKEIPNKQLRFVAETFNTLSKDTTKESFASKVKSF